MTTSKELLNEATQRLTEELEIVEKEMRDFGAAPDGSLDASALDEGFADAAQATSERAKVLSIVEGLQTRLTEVKAALVRVEKGTYGKCERCGEDIDAERLEAIPWVRLCRSCAQKK